jgi:hypothetical protein
MAGTDVLALIKENSTRPKVQSDIPAVAKYRGCVLSEKRPAIGD